GAEWRFLNITPVGGNGGAAAIGAPENDAAVGWRRMQNHGDPDTRMHANAAARHCRLQRPLCNNPQRHELTPRKKSANCPSRPTELTGEKARYQITLYE